ncbi:CLD22 protein, partial [Polyodon spathula]|nr:CLD22 protein [Polyodon spathula]
MVLITSKSVQFGAFFVSLVGFVISFVTTFLPMWKTLNTDLNEMENWYQGLWHTCVFQDEVGLQCKAYDSFLALPADIVVSRVMMFISIMMGLLSLIVTMFGMDCVKLGDGKEEMKKKLLILGGVLSVVSGITTLFPVSMVAYAIVSEFWDDNLPDIVPRWEFGEAMFSGWFAGLFLLLGGSFLFVELMTVMAILDLQSSRRTHNVTSPNTCCPMMIEVKIEVVVPEKEKERDKMSPNGTASSVANCKPNGTTKHPCDESLALSAYQNPRDLVEAAVCHVRDLENGQMREVDVGGGKALLIKEHGEYSAISHKCPHYGAPLVKGKWN